MNFENLEQTISLMLSGDYKERFKAEYLQLKIRLTKLSDMIEKYQNGTLDFQPVCDISLLIDQCLAMTLYLILLEKRAKEEGITLDQFSRGFVL